MDDLSAKLSGILSDPEAMKEIAQLASSLGVESPGVHNEPPADKGTMAMLGGLMPLIGSLKEEDDTTRLLDAIRPFLSGERREKLDKAKKLMRLMRLLPMLRGLDLFEL